MNFCAPTVFSFSFFFFFLSDEQVQQLFHLNLLLSNRESLASSQPIHVTPITSAVGFFDQRSWFLPPASAVSAWKYLLPPLPLPPVATRRTVSLDLSVMLGTPSSTPSSLSPNAATPSSSSSPRVAAGPLGQRCHLTVRALPELQRDATAVASTPRGGGHTPPPPPPPTPPPPRRFLLVMQGSGAHGLGFGPTFAGRPHGRVGSQLRP